MTAGRELDALVAEHLMGWPEARLVPRYSTDIAAAWSVVEKVMSEGWTVTLAPRQFERFPEDRFKFHGCRLMGTPQKMYSFSGHSDTAPRAICIAALRSVGVEVE